LYVKSSKARSNRQKQIMIALRTGRLANRLVLFANFIGFVEEHQHRLVNVTFHSYAHLFETTRRDIYCRYPVPTRRSSFDLLPGAAALIRKTRIFYQLTRAACVVNGQFPLFGKRFMTLEETFSGGVTLLDDSEIARQMTEAKTIFAYGWRFRAPEAVKKHAEIIRAYFRPIEQIERNCQNSIDSLRENAEIIVGVHARRGDYRNWKNGRFFFQVERYVAWMKEMEAQFPGRKVAFFVCSDETLNRDVFGHLSVTIGRGAPVNDLYTLAKCDFIFGPPSTFSQWSSFYGKVPLLHLRRSDECIAIGKFGISFFEDIP
jgi:hypothetical protein